MNKRFIFRVLAVSLLCQIVFLSASVSATGWKHHNYFNKDFVQRHGSSLWLNGRPFRFAGSNNYYPMYKSPFMVDSVLETAAENGFQVMRMWGSLDIGNQDWSNSIHTNPEGVYFHYWDVETGQPAFNDGEDGLQHLDYVVAKAGELGLKVVFPLTNNWRDFGGMDQYVRWRETQLGADARDFYHSDFYTDPVIVQWYKDWIAHLLNRVNIYTGLQYKDDPTIMTWELANEPRCKGSGVYPYDANCTTETMIGWVDEISTYIKSIDSNHLVSTGDEGFYCVESPEHWTENCGEGVDTIAFTRLKNIDVMSFHLYPDSWGTDAEWSKQWIKRHLQDARKLHKPAMLGEFGWADKATRNPIYKEWTDTVLRYGGDGALYWILSGKQDDGTLYPDYDGYTVYCPSPVCTTITNFSERISKPFGWLRFFNPVADHEEAVTESETTVTLNPAANDIAYGFYNSVQAGSIDLDSSTVVQDTVLTTAGGTFTLMADDSVEFVPAAGFYGDVIISYNIRDRFNRVSNNADIKITVKPLPGQPIQLFSFETGTEGWIAADWAPGAGNVSQSNAFATDGANSLAVNSIDGGWFMVSFNPPLNLSDGYSTIDLDLSINDANGGTWHSVALQTGDAWDWCEGAGQWIPNSNVSVQMDLLSLSCGAPDLSQIHRMLVHFNGDGFMDNIWAR